MIKFIFGQTRWYQKMMHERYIEENKNFPNGREISTRYNSFKNDESYSLINWMNYYGNNDNVKHEVL